VNADVAKLLDQISTGLSQTVKRIARSAVRLLLQAYDWVLVLLGKDGEAQARKKVADWLEELKKEPKDEGGVIAGLVNRLYRPDSIGNEVNNWLEANQVEVATINGAAESVQGLGQKYEVKSDQAGKVLIAIGIIKSLPVPFVKIPQLQTLFAAVSLGILGYVLFTGYDHVDSGRIQFLKRFGINIPDRVEGIRETVQKALASPNYGTESKSA
jgi:hypothetical protein